MKTEQINDIEKIAKRYFNKYFKHQYFKKSDFEFKAFVRILKNQLLSTQAGNQICHICNGQGSIKRIDKESTSLYETCPECHGNLMSTPPTEDKVIDVHVIMEQMYKEFEYNVGKPKLVHVGKPTHMWEQMFKSSVKHALLQIAKNQFGQSQTKK